MSSKKIICLLIIVMTAFLGLCGCKSEFDKVREMTETNQFLKQESTPKISDFEVSNVHVDFASSSTYSNYLDVVGIVKNKSNKEASCITLTIYLYQNGSLILTEEEYVFDLAPYDEKTFEFMLDSIKVFTCDDMVVKVTDVF